MTKRKLAVWFVTVCVFTVLDFVWVSTLASSFYKEKLSALAEVQKNILPASFALASLLYVILATGLVIFLFRVYESGGELRDCAGYGAFLGFVIYATFDLTNTFLISGWSLDLSVVDIGWGTFQGLIAGLNVYWLRRKLKA